MRHDPSLARLVAPGRRRLALARLDRLTGVIALAAAAAAFALVPGRLLFTITMGSLING
ncbi:MAG: hypothetical protein QOH47_838 [Sphingomonadales bacterium]|jgi:hypothetical protein|nr:hypothetical protein [Sphingomonadales bacterium]